MGSRLSALLGCLSALSLACAAPGPAEPARTYPGVVRWHGVSKAQLYDALVRSLHFQDDYEVLPMGTARDTGLIAVRKGGDDDTVYKLFRQADGRYAPYWAARVRLTFLVEDAAGAAQVSVRPRFRIMCLKQNLSASWYAPCQPTSFQAPGVHQAISNRLREDLDAIYAEVAARFGSPASADHRYYGHKGSVPQDGIRGATGRTGSSASDSRRGSLFDDLVRPEVPPAAPAADEDQVDLETRRVTGLAPAYGANGRIVGFIRSPDAAPLTVVCVKQCWSGDPTPAQLIQAIRSGAARIVPDP